MTFEEQAAQMNREELLAAILSLHKESEEKRGRIFELCERVAALSTCNNELEQHNSELQQQKAALAVQLEWFKRQLFGEKSERRLPALPSEQLHLGEMLEDERPPAPKETVKEYERRRRPKERLEGSPDDSGLRFDASVPVQLVPVKNPEIEGLTPDEYEVVTEKVTYRLAQRPGAYVVLKYVRPVVKVKATGKMSSPAAPAAVLGKSFSDVSLLAGLLVDKCMYHLPLYRQHQRLLGCGIKISRGTLTNLVQRAITLLEPIYFAVLSSILQSEVLLMDETPTKAGRAKPGKMRLGYFWPIYGDKDEIAFPFAASRAEKVVREVLGAYCGILLTDGYKVYEKYCEKVGGIVHAQCWAHTRRKFIEAEKAEPGLVDEALKKIRALYEIEDQISARGLKEPEKLCYRREHSTACVDEFFQWLNEIFKKQVLLPSNLFTKAASYALHREKALRVFLDHPGVDLDTNKDERALRPIPTGRKNWLFCWTELGGRYLGIAQTLIQSCRLQDVDPWVYLVDVLQRIETHPALEVHLLTPRLWKENFAGNPLRSDVQGGATS
jgi:transposase